MTRTTIVGSVYIVLLFGLLAIAVGSFPIRLDQFTARSPSQSCPTVLSTPNTLPIPDDSSWATAATSTVGDVSLELRLPPGPRLMGEAPSVEVVAHNTGRDEVSIEVAFAANIDVIDEAGQPWPHRGFLPGDAPESGPPPNPRVLKPGETLNFVETVQLPFTQDVGSHVYRLTARVRVGGPSAPANEGAWPRLTATSPPLVLDRPKPAQELHAELRHAESRWCLVVTDGAGMRPTTPLNAEMWTTTDRGATLGVWHDEMRGVWPDVQRQWPVEGGPGKVEIWVAAQGYVTAQVESTFTIPPAPPLTIFTPAPKALPTTAIAGEIVPPTPTTPDFRRN